VLSEIVVIGLLDVPCIAVNSEMTESLVLPSRGTFVKLDIVDMDGTTVLGTTHDRRH
jgi:hypothetical protein